VIEVISGHEQSLGVILNTIAEATHEAQVVAELQLRDIELLPSRLLAAVFDAPGTA
jgi:hypothetical protein